MFKILNFASKFSQNGVLSPIFLFLDISFLTRINFSAAQILFRGVTPYLLATMLLVVGVVFVDD